MHKMMDNFSDNGRKGLAARTLTVLLVAILVVYFVSRNWSWYKNDLSDDGIRPEWASEYINIVTWVIWYLTLGWLWSYHLRYHPDSRKINMMYVGILGFTFMWQVYMFENRTFTFPKFIASLVLLMMLYLMYDAYTRGLYMVVFSLIVHTLIVAWAVMQLWYSDSKMNQENCSDTGSEYSHPWSSQPGYAGWYPRPRSQIGRGRWM